ncbi:MAG: EscN/YscN/HrcN family type III secretion system ATPase, partial [Fibrobacterales bacterium]
MWSDPFVHAINKVPEYRQSGTISEIIGLVIESTGPSAAIGELCEIMDGDRVACRAEVVGFKESRTLLMPLGQMQGIRPGMIVQTTGQTLAVDLARSMLGRIIDGLGNPMDEKGPVEIEERRSIYAEPPNALKRTRIKTPMHTGLKAIDGFLTVGCGQRMGIFAGSGVGKSVTMGMIARNCLAQVNVIALIGERGR